MTSQDITGLLVAWSGGDEESLRQLIPLVEKELHRLAAGFMRREGPGHVLQTTALEIQGDRIAGIYIVRNPDKLAHIGALADPQTGHAD